MRNRSFTCNMPAVALFLILFSGCKKYLDVVPDNVATLENAFTVRTQAQKFLATCYSYMPRNGDFSNDPATQGGDEIWRIITNGGNMFNIARGLMNSTNPYGDNWQTMYRALRDCNIF